MWSSCENQYIEATFFAAVITAAFWDMLLILVAFNYQWVPLPNMWFIHGDLKYLLFPNLTEPMVLQLSKCSLWYYGLPNYGSTCRSLATSSLEVCGKTPHCEWRCSPCQETISIPEAFHLSTAALVLSMLNAWSCWNSLNVFWHHAVLKETCSKAFYERHLFGESKSVIYLRNNLFFRFLTVQFLTGFARWNLLVSF